MVLQTLDSILEVGIGIAGFSGVVIAFGRGDWSARAMHLLPTLLDISFVVIVLSFVPMVLLSTNIASALIWQIASGLTAMYIAMVIPYRSLRLKQLHLDPSKRGRQLGLLINAAVFALSLANVFWLQSEWPHLVSLVTMLVLAFGVFSFLVSEVLTQNQWSQIRMTRPSMRVDSVDNPRESNRSNA